MKKPRHGGRGFWVNGNIPYALRIDSNVFPHPDPKQDGDAPLPRGALPRDR
jgi:hypothetical protein